MQKILITKETAGARLDKFLTKEFFSLSRGEVIRQIKAGLVEINGTKAKPSQELKEHDLISVLFSPEAKIKQLPPNNGVILNILHEDANLLVINKPAGLQVHPGHQNEQDTLVNGLLAYLPALATVHDESSLAWQRPGIVHRLDKDTSGVMVIAKNQTTFTELKKLFQTRKITKKYLALVYGQLKEKEGIIEKEIARSGDYRKQVIANHKTKTVVRPAITEYKVVQEGQNFSLLEVLPRTGRMHQIRVHLASLGHPIVGDALYQNKKNLPMETEKLTRQFLHAQELSLELFGQKHTFSAPLPADLAGFLANID